MVRSEPNVTQPRKVLVLTGTIAAGKTTLAEAVSQELHARSIRHALIDLDWLGQIYPVPEGHDPYNYELAIENLKAIWPSFLAAGATRAVIAGTILNAEQLGRLTFALGGAALQVVLVTAPDEVLHGRICRRDAGSLREDFLARTAALAKEIEAAAIHELVVVNDGAGPGAVANDLLRRAGWD